MSNPLSINGLVGVRINFKCGVSAMMVRVPLQEAIELIESWRSGCSGVVGGKEEFPGGIYWAVDLSDVQSINTVDLAQLQMQQQQQLAGMGPSTQLTTPPQQFPMSGIRR